MRHELHLTKAGLRAAIPAACLLVAAGLVLGGGRGAASAACGAGLVVANQLAAAGSTAWSRTINPSVVAVGYAMFVVRMFAMFAAFVAVASFGWIDAPLFAAAFCAVLVVTLAAQCVSYMRGTYVPNWRMVR
jgi:hypothetical protein